MRGLKVLGSRTSPLIPAHSASKTRVNALMLGIQSIIPGLGPRFRGDERRGIPLMPKTPDHFVGKTIIITGAASGIGRAAALIFAREGANVVCADVDGDGNRETADRITGQGGRGKALALRTDVTSRQQVDDLVRQAIETFGAVHFQFNSAGAA